MFTWKMPNLNTSYVKVKQDYIQNPSRIFSNLNTSYVKVKLDNR